MSAKYHEFTINVVFNAINQLMTVDQLITSIYTIDMKKKSLVIDFTTVGLDSVHVKLQCQLFVHLCLLLKLLRCHKDYLSLNQRCSILIIDNAECMCARHEYHKQSLKQAYETPLIWLHPGVFAMWIGHNVDVSKHPLNETAICIQTNLILFDLLDNKQTFLGIDNCKTFNELRHLGKRLQCDDLIEEYFKNQQREFSETQVKQLLGQLLYHLSITTASNSEIVLPLIALLPIFPIMQMSKNGTTYTKYNKAISYLYSNGNVDNDYSVYDYDNVLCVPFHIGFLIDNNNANSLSMIQLLIQQSNAFKICHQVLNFAYCEQHHQDFNNFVMFDGSKSGKTTFLVSLFFYYLFSNRKIPVVIQRNYKKSLNQNIQNLSNLKIGEELNKLNVNYNNALTLWIDSKTDVSYNVIYQLISANLKDLLAYPTTMQTISDNIMKSAVQTVRAKKYLITDQEQIENKFKIIYLFSQYQQSSLKHRSHIFWELCDNENIEAQIFGYFDYIQAIEYDIVQERDLGLSQIVLLFDEVCFQRDSIINCTKLSKLNQIVNFINPPTKSMYEALLKYRDELVLILQQGSAVSNSDKVNLAINFLLGNSDGLNQAVLLLMCPLVLFTHFQNEQQQNNNDFQELFVELQNTQGFEAIALRNIQSIISNKRQVHRSGFAECFTEQLIIQQLGRLIGQKDCAIKTTSSTGQSQMTYNLVEQFDSKFVGSINIISVYAGTNICMSNFVDNTKFVRPSLSSRDPITAFEQQCHTAILEKPQLQPNCTNYKYYKLGLDFCTNTSVMATVQNDHNIITIADIIDTIKLVGLDAAIQLQIKNSTVTPQLIVFNELNQIVYHKSHQNLVNITPNCLLVNKVNIRLYCQIIGIFKEQNRQQQNGEIQKYVSLRKVDLTTQLQSHRQCIMPLNAVNSQIIVQTLSYQNILVAATQLHIELQKLFEITVQQIVVLNIDILKDQGLVTNYKIFERLWLLHLLAQLGNNQNASAMIHELIKRISQQIDPVKTYQLDCDALSIIKEKIIPFIDQCIITSIQHELLSDDSIDGFVNRHVEIATLVATGVFENVSPKSKMVIVSVTADDEHLKKLHKNIKQCRQQASNISTHENEYIHIQNQCLKNVGQQNKTYDDIPSKPDYLIVIIIKSDFKPDIGGLDYDKCIGDLHIFHVAFEVGNHSETKLKKKCGRSKYIQLQFSNSTQLYTLSGDTKIDNNDQAQIKITIESPQKMMRPVMKRITNQKKVEKVEITIEESNKSKIYPQHSLNRAIADQKLEILEININQDVIITFDESDVIITFEEDDEDI